MDKRRALSRALLAMIAIAALTTGVDARARGQVIKLGTMAPAGTLPHKTLLRIAEVFAEETAGQVQVKIYAGVVGDEPTIVRKLRVGQLQAALLTSKGLATITPEPMAMQLPMLFADDAEIDAVLAAMQPSFDRALRADGFESLAWVDGGWMYFFTTRPAVAVEDLAGRRMWMWPHDDGAVASFAALGVEPVVLSDLDILPSLRTGMVEVFPTTPIAALALQTDRVTPHLVDVPLAFMLAGLVVDRSTWNKLPGDARKRIRKRCAVLGRELSAQVRRDSVTAIAAMQRRGLTVHRPGKAQLRAWHARASRAREVAVGRSVSAELVEQVLRARAAHRSQQN